MTTRSIFLPDAIHAWLQTNTLRESALLGRLRAETATLAEASYQIAPEQGQMLTFLIELTAARNTLDIGTFTGYSALVAAAAMPAEGRVVACDVSAGWTGIARRYWAEAGVEDRIDLRLGPALATLDGLCAEGRAGTFDFALIDADKEPYPDYYERALVLLRPGGVVALDNMLWRGLVAESGPGKPKTEMFRRLNRFIRDDRRVTPVTLPIGDGMTLARKR